MKVFLFFVYMALAVCAGLAIGSCAHNPPPAPADASPPPFTATCASVCEHAALMDCTWAKPTPKGHSCEQVCLNAQNVGEPWNLECLQKLTGCDSAFVCP